MFADFLIGCLVGLVTMLLIGVIVTLALGPFVLAIFVHPAWLFLYFATIPIMAGICEIADGL